MEARAAKRVWYRHPRRVWSGALVPGPQMDLARLVLPSTRQGLRPRQLQHLIQLLGVERLGQPQHEMLQPRLQPLVDLPLRAQRDVGRALDLLRIAPDLPAVPVQDL